MAKEIKFNVKLLVDGKEQLVTATTSVAELRKNIEAAKPAADQFREKLITLNQSVETLKNLSGAMNTLRDTMAGLTATYNAVQTSNTMLTTVMKQRINATDEDIKKVKEVISAQTELGVLGGTVQRMGAQQIATFLKEKGTLEVLIPAMNDLVAQQKGISATGEDARGVANLMGKAMMGQTSALRRVGITFTSAQEQIMKYGTEQQRAAMLAQIITDNVGHMNAALAKTDAGRLKQLENGFGSVKAKIGEMVAAWMPAIAITAQSLTIATSVITLTNSFKGVVAVLGNFCNLTKLTGVVCTTARSAMMGLSAVTQVAKAAFTGAAVGATTLKVAIKSLLISSGVGVAIWALTEAISYFATSSDRAKDSTRELTAEEEAAKAAKEQEAKQAAQVSAALDINITKLKEFKGSKEEEKKLVAEMNSTYGKTMGYYSTVAQWYTALVGNSKAYCAQMINEIRIRNLADKAAELAQQRHDIGYDENGKARKYSKKNKTRHVYRMKEDGMGGYTPEYSEEEIKGSSDWDEAKKKAAEIAQQERALKKEMATLVGKNASTQYNHYAGYSKTDTTAPTVTPKTGGKTGTTTTTTTDNPEPLENSIDWYEKQLQKLREQINAAADEGVAKAKQAEYERVEGQLKDLKVRIGVEKAPETEVKTKLQQLNDYLKHEQDAFDATDPLNIEAKVKAAARVADIQSQIDAATKGSLTIKADVEPTYIAKGSTADKRQSYDNAKSKAGRIQSDFEIGLIGKDEAEKQIAELNKQIAELGAGMKPLELEVDASGFDKAFGSIKDGWGSVQGVGSGIESMTNALEGDGDAWQTVCGVINGFINVAEGIQGIVALINLLTGATQAHSAASAVDAATTTAETGAAIANTAAKSGEAVAEATSSGAKMPFPLNLVAIAAGVAAVIAALAAVSRFATGGVIGGTSTSGDKKFARVNSGEMILNKFQQARLFAMVNGQFQPPTFSERRLQPVTVRNVANYVEPAQTQVNVNLNANARKMLQLMTDTKHVAAKSGKTFA